MRIARRRCFRESLDSAELESFHLFRTPEHDDRLGFGKEDYAHDEHEWDWPQSLYIVSSVADARPRMPTGYSTREMYELRSSVQFLCTSDIRVVGDKDHDEVTSGIVSRPH